LRDGKRKVGCGTAQKSLSPKQIYREKEGYKKEEGKEVFTAE